MLPRLSGRAPGSRSFRRHDRGYSLLAVMLIEETSHPDSAEFDGCKTQLGPKSTATDGGTA